MPKKVVPFPKDKRFADSSLPGPEYLPWKKSKVELEFRARYREELLMKLFTAERLSLRKHVKPVAFPQLPLSMEGGTLPGSQDQESNSDMGDASMAEPAPSRMPSPGRFSRGKKRASDALVIPGLERPPR